MSLPTSTETFTAANGTALTTYSSSWSLNAGDFAIQTNRLVPNGATSTTECAARWNADTFPNDQYAEATVPSLSGGGVNERSGVGVRIATDGSANYYGLYYDDDLSNVLMFKVVAGVWTQLGAAFAALAAGDVIRLEVIGTTLEYFKNTVSQGTRTDTDLTAGSAGVVGKGISAAQSLDDWTAGSLAGTAADTGTAMASIVESDVVSGAKTIITTLTGETFAPASVPQNPIYVGGQVGGRAGSTSTSSVNFVLTGGIDTLPRAGDYVIIEVTVGSAGRNNPQAITTPAGYSAIGQLNSASAAFDTSMNVSRKFMGGTPDTSFTLPSTGNIQDAQRYLVQVWRNVDPTTPDDVTPVSATGAGVTSRPNPGSITPVTAGAVVVILGAGAAGTGANYTAPANYTTDFLTGFTADTNDALIGGGYRTDWTSGAEDPAAFGGGSNTTSDSWAAYTLALRPAPALTPFDDARQARIDGLVSAQSEANGWNAERPNIPVTAVVRTSDTVCTITLPALSAYDITAQETVTDTIPGSILAGGNPIVATPTFTIDPSGGGGPAASGSGLASAASRVIASGFKSTSGAGVARAATRTISTGAKGAVSFGAVSSAERAIATGAKGASGAGIVSSASRVTGIGASNPPVTGYGLSKSASRVVATGTKGASSAAASTAASKAITTGIKGAIGAAVIHDSTFALEAGIKSGFGAGVARAIVSATTTGAKAVAGGGTSSSAERVIAFGSSAAIIGGFGKASTASRVTAAGFKNTQGQARAGADARTIAIGVKTSGAPARAASSSRATAFGFKSTSGAARVSGCGSDNATGIKGAFGTFKVNAQARVTSIPASARFLVVVVSATSQYDVRNSSTSALEATATGQSQFNLRSST